MKNRKIVKKIYNNFLNSPENNWEKIGQNWFYCGLQLEKEEEGKTRIHIYTVGSTHSSRRVSQLSLVHRFWQSLPPKGIQFLTGIYR